MRCLDGLRKHARSVRMQCNWTQPYAFPESRTLRHIVDLKMSQNWRRLSESLACRNEYAVPPRCYSCCKCGGLVAPVSADEADEHLRHDLSSMSVVVALFGLGAMS